MHPLPIWPVHSEMQTRVLADISNLERVDMNTVASQAPRARFAFTVLAVLLAICFALWTAAMPIPHSVTASGQKAASNKPLHWAADVPLLQCDGLPCIEARINGAPARLLIDTGDQASILDTAGAKKFGVQPYKPDQPGWPENIFRATIPALAIGALKLSVVRVLTMGMAGMIAQNQMPHADGTLAYTAFKDRVLQLDFHAHRLRVSDTISSPLPCPRACDTFSFITFGKHGPPIVVAKGFSINGRAVTAQIDSLYSGSLLVYTASIDKLGFSAAAKATKTRNFPYTDGGVKMKFAPAREESFHGIPLATSGALVYFPTPGVHEPDGLFDATVGIALFRDAVLTLDFHNMKVSVQKG